MPDFRRQRDAARTERDQLRRDNANLHAILGDIAPEYAQAYADLCDLALHGMTRPDDLGRPISMNHAESTPPRYHAAAYHYRSEERRIQRERANRLRSIVEALTEYVAHPMPTRRTLNQTQTLAQPSRNNVSSTPFC